MAQEVYKTQVTCEVGYSICMPSASPGSPGDWVKNRVCISSDVGPGYPDATMMHSVLMQQINDATGACDEQIQQIANKIIAEVQGGAR